MPLPTRSHVGQADRVMVCRRHANRRTNSGQSKSAETIGKSDAERFIYKTALERRTQKEEHPVSGDGWRARGGFDALYADRDRNQTGRRECDQTGQNTVMYRQGYGDAIGLPVTKSAVGWCVGPMPERRDPRCFGGALRARSDNGDRILDFSPDPGVRMGECAERG